MEYGLKCSNCTTQEAGAQGGLCDGTLHPPLPQDFIPYRTLGKGISENHRSRRKAQKSQIGTRHVHLAYPWVGSEPRARCQSEDSSV